MSEHTLRGPVDLVFDFVWSVSLSVMATVSGDATFTVAVGHSQRSTIWQRHSSQKATFIQTCWSLETSFWSCRTPVWEMADSHETHFNAPLVTKAHWIKPGSVSIFTWETCRMKSSLDSTLYKELFSLFSRGLNNSQEKRRTWQFMTSQFLYKYTLVGEHF